MYRKLLISALPVLVIGGFVGWLVVSARKGKPETPAVEGARPAVQEAVSVLPAPDVPQEPPVEAPPQKREEAVEAVPEEPPAAAPVQEKVPSPEELSGSALWKGLVAGDFGLRFITLLDEVTMGFLPSKSLGQYKSRLPFAAHEENGEWFLAPETEGRYAPLVDLFCSLDAELAGKVYRGVRPALLEAMKACGHGRRTPEEMVQAAMERLRQVPLYESNPPMVKVSEGKYAWKYPELEALSPVQKAILRMGQGNLRRIREKSEQLVVEIGE